MTLTRTVCLSLVWCLAMGCSYPGWRQRRCIAPVGAPGQVRTVTGAQIRVECPRYEPGGHARTNDGDFVVLGRGPGLSLDCSLVVEKAGYLPARMSIGTICIRLYPDEQRVKRRRERVCSYAEVQVTLTARANSTHLSERVPVLLR